MPTNFTVYLCPDCGHRSMDHRKSAQAGDTCSMAWCPCRTVAADLEASVDGIVRTAIPDRVGDR